MSIQTPPVRRIRSFVRRRGRITAAQKEALEKLWPVYGLDPEIRFETRQVFGRKAPLTIEIGFGNGANLAENAARNPQTDYLGIEVHEPGIGHLMNLLATRGIGNVRIYQGDAVDILATKIEDASVDRINLFFPDPWPKKRHHKRRLVSLDFVNLISRKLRPGGYFHAATDCQEYADRITEALENCERLSPITDRVEASAVIAERSPTRFEQRGLSLGYPVREILFLKR
ncbi:MAG: tRNA (guanosine(46)-N7)-methyltransferase TrmB [Gammaproteobacteria bacterium]